MSNHDELVTEMATLEKMSVQERLKHARKRRAQQLKRYNQADKEHARRQRKNTNQMNLERKNRRHVTFAKNVELLEAAARGDIDEVRNLLESGVDPNIGNEDGLTALHQSCIDNNEAMMRLLIEKGANVNVTDRELWTPLHAASTCGHRHLAQHLISRGAKLLSINSDGNMPYDICEDELTLDYIESQMAAQGITQEQIDDLREVVPNQMLRELEELNKDGSDLEYRDNSGATPLHIAVANGYEKVVQYLINNNADVSAKDNDGWQPIHAAVCWSQSEIITMLVEAGADLDAKTYNNETPETICEDSEIGELIDELKHAIKTNRIKAPNLVRRSSSRNKRGSSIRRSSKREKGEMRRLDAKGEAAYIMQSKSEELGGSTDIQVTNIDDVQLSEGSANGHIEQQSDATNGEPKEDGEEVNHLPSIIEELDNPESPRNKKPAPNGDAVNGDVSENGDLDLDGAPSIAQQKRLVSILKKRPEDAELSKETKKSKKELKEEKEKTKKEQKERERQEKARAKEEKAKKKEQKKKEEEEAAKTGSKVAEGGEEQGVEEGDQYYKDTVGAGTTLSELKRQRSLKQTPGMDGDSPAVQDPSEDPSSNPSTTPASNEKTPSTKQASKGPHAKIRIHRPLTGRYDFKVDDPQGQNGDAVSEGDQETTLTSAEMKRFSGVAEVVGEEDNRSCCTIS